MIELQDERGNAAVLKEVAWVKMVQVPVGENKISVLTWFSAMSVKGLKLRIVIANIVIL